MPRRAVCATIDLEMETAEPAGWYRIEPHAKAASPQRPPKTRNAARPAAAPESSAGLLPAWRESFLAKLQEHEDADDDDRSFRRSSVYEKLARPTTRSGLNDQGARPALCPRPHGGRC